MRAERRTRSSALIGRRWHAVVLLVAALGCRGDGEQAEPKSWVHVRASKGQPWALAALMMPHAAILAGLGPHRVTARCRLEREVERFGKTVVEQSIVISTDSGGGFHARKNTHRQYGSEVIWTGRKLYARSRYGRFLERDPTDVGEPKRIAERMYGLLPAYLRLLEPFVGVKASGHGWRSRRRAEHVILKRADNVDDVPEVAGPAQKWRETILVGSLEGDAWLDDQSGAALEVTLDAQWTYALPAGPPPEGGVPESVVPDQRGIMRVKIHQAIDHIGKIRPIGAPLRRNITPDSRRLRPEIERQIVVGQRPLPK